VTLNRERIVAEAVALLDAEGLDGVTTRKLAARLGVRSPTLYWHVPNKAALVTALTVERFTVGHVLEEQAPRPDAEALKDFDMAAFAERHPTAIAAITEYFRPGRTVDDLFRECLEVVIEGASVKAGSPS
jgi:AcrR family transcriptional regulator